MISVQDKRQMFKVVLASFFLVIGCKGVSPTGEGVLSLKRV